MIRTNSKKAMEAIRNYVMNNTDFEGFGYEGIDENPTTFEEMAKTIWGVYWSEIGHFNKGREPWQVNFMGWLAGLPSCGLGDFFYHGSTVDALGEMLEQTEAERSKYTEEQAENTLSYLIYREIAKFI